MKKVLLASTALAFSAGMAAAEITITGSAEMGIKGGDRYDDADTDNTVEDNARFHQDYTIKVVGSGETDNGLTFGMSVEFDDVGNDAVNDGTTTDNEFVFISGSFGTLTLGEIDGAYDKAMAEVALAGGSLADDETEHAGFNGNSGFDGTQDNQILRYDYAFGDFGVSVSYEQFNNGQDGDSAVVIGSDPDDNIGIGVTYSTQWTGVEMTFGLAYQQGSKAFDADGTEGAYWYDGDVWGASVAADFGNGFQAGLNYSSYDFDGTATATTGTVGAETAKSGTDYDHYGIGMAYTMNAWTFAANYGKYDYSGGVADEDGWGLLVNYDLGGGAVMQFGYGEGESTESWSFGIAMSF
ncbi:MAG: porin [Rhodovulum sp.]